MLGGISIKLEPLWAHGKTRVDSDEDMVTCNNSVKGGAENTIKMMPMKQCGLTNVNHPAKRFHDACLPARHAQA